MVANMAIMLAINGIIKAVAYAWDKLNVTVEEQQAKVDELTSSYNGLKSEYDSLRTKENLTSAEEDRLDYLERQLELQEKLLEIETKRLYQNKVGTSWTDIFDGESLANKQFDEENGFSQKSFVNQKSKYNTLIESYRQVHNSGNTLGEEQSIASLEDMYDDLVIKQSDFLANMHEAQEATKYLTGEDQKVAEEQAKYWETAYNEVCLMVDEIDKIQGRYDFDPERLSGRLGGSISADELKNEFSSEEIDLLLEAKFDKNASIEELRTLVDSLQKEADGNPVTPKVEFSKTQMIDTINSMADGFDVLDDIYADVLDGGTFDFTKLDTSKFSEAFSEITPEYEKFIETVSASPTDIDACQGAFNDLVSAFIDSKGILEGVDEETKQLTIDMLENMGVANAEEVVISSLGMSFDDYAAAKRECVLAGVDLLTATDAEIQSLINEKLVSEETAQALFHYQLQKALSNENGINTANDCANLRMLAENAGITGGILEDLIELEQIQRQLESGQIISEHMVSKLMARAEELNTSIKSQSASFQTTVKPITQYTGAGKTATAQNKKLKDSTDAVTEAMEKEKKALESTKSELEKQKQYYEDVIEAVNWFYDQKIDDAQKSIDKLEKENELIEKQLDMYDGALSAIDRYYEAQQQKLRDRIDAMEDENDEAERALKLEQAKDALIEARNRKSIMLYEKGKGFVYSEDQSEIKSAEETLANVQQEQVKAELEAEIELLQKYRDAWAEIPNIKEQAEQESQMIQMLGAEWESILLNGRIENLTSFKDQYVSLQQQIDDNTGLIESYEQKIEYYESLKAEWEELTNRYQEDTYRQLLVGAFGNDYENELLNGRTERWEQFADEYYDVQVKLKEVTDQIEALAQRMESYASRMESAANRAVSAANKFNNAQTSMSSSEGQGGWTGYSMFKNYNGAKKAKGGIITKKDSGDLDFVAKSLGEDHMIATQEGEAVIPKNTVKANKELINTLLSADGKSIKTDSIHYDMSKFVFDEIPRTNWKITNNDWNNKVREVKKETVLQFYGDLSFPNIHSGNDAKILMSELSQLARKADQYAHKRN